MRPPRSLRTRLVVSAVALIAVVCAVIGTVTAVALHSYLYERLDQQLADVAKRAAGPGKSPEGTAPAPDELPRDAFRFLALGGQDIGTLGATVSGDTVTEARISEPGGDDGRPAQVADLGAEVRTALGDVAQDGNPHTVELPGLGAYRVQSTASPDYGAMLVGVPTSGVENTVSTLIVVELCVAGAGLVAASIAGAVLVGVALRPLRKVAATATHVAELPLHHGEPALHPRVPDADPRTEVGQVGAALNRMLDHVHDALRARQDSETRVRQFVADASHELRTPLASIRGYAELTRRGREETGPDTRRALTRIESEAARMTGLVEDLLLLARLDAGRPLAYEATDLSLLVADAVGDARAAGPDHRWRLELPDTPVSVGADAARLHQVLVNLLANARTHTPPGTTITARALACGTTARLQVEDDGPGIPPDLLPYVFERFARGDASRSRNAGSTGLGLAIVRAVVAAHGGSAGVESGPGRTVFTVELPAPGADPGAEPPASGADPGADRAAAIAQQQAQPQAQSQPPHRLSTQP
ncbi:sensor histidine kinase [Streptomyces sp. NPDC050418]|uniref:sensor histidine kinase n=1 Tax=Streptomyces sp. NPDC050418 TaxID=3365612 RepID=UPI0037B36993